jgi:hypothetical protein
MRELKFLQCDLCRAPARVPCSTIDPTNLIGRKVEKAPLALTLSLLHMKLQSIVRMAFPTSKL